MSEEKPTILKRSISIPSSGLMTVEQTAAYLGMSKRQFYRLPVRPPESKVVPHRYLIDDVNEWLRDAA